MWWKPVPGSFGEAEARAAWELLVEMRTAVPEVDVESLAAKASEVATWVAGRWPTFSEEISGIVAALRRDPGSPVHRVRLENLADELEDHLDVGLRWPDKGSHDS